MQLGLTFPDLYDSCWRVESSPEMAMSEELLRVVSAAQADSVMAYVEATDQLLTRFPEPAALTMRLQALSRARDMLDVKDLRAAFEDALACFERANPGNPNTDYIRSVLGEMSGILIPRVESIETATRLLARRDLTTAFRAELLRHRADNLRAIGKTANAITDLEEALSLEPTNPATYWVLSGVYRNTNELDKSLRTAERGLSILPASWLSLTLVGETYRLMGRPEDAIRYLRQAYSIHKTTDAYQPQRICAQYAMVLHQVGREAEARNIAREGESLKPDQADGVYYLACYWALAENRDKSLELLRRALVLGFEDLEITYDPAWTRLRGDPAFEAIVTEVRQRLERH